MRRAALLLVLAALAGCSGPVSSAPPDSRVEVTAGYPEGALAGRSLAVVVGAVVVTDDAVAEHLGGSLDAADETYRAFFAEALPVAFQTAEVGEVRVADAAALGLAATRPADGARFDALDADFVLLLDTLHVDRAVYYRTVAGAPNPQTGAMSQRTVSDHNLRIDAGVVLWDNRAGAEVAAGRLDTERSLPIVGRSRATYEDAVREFVEQLARFTPLSLRR